MYMYIQHFHVYMQELKWNLSNLGNLGKEASVSITDFRECTVHKHGVWDSQMCPDSRCPD